MKLYEWIADSNLLLALIIGVIVLFLIVCCICFYCAFYPDGIPDHLTKEKPEPVEMAEEEQPMMMMEAAD